MLFEHIYFAQLTMFQVPDDLDVNVREALQDSEEPSQEEASKYCMERDGRLEASNTN